MSRQNMSDIAIVRMSDTRGIHLHIRVLYPTQMSRYCLSVALYEPIKPLYNTTANNFKQSSVNRSKNNKPQVDGELDNDVSHVNESIQTKSSPLTPGSFPERLISSRGFDWAEGLHEGCPIKGRHRHSTSGGVYFPSAAHVLETVRAMEPTISLSDLADAIRLADAEV